MASKLTVKRTTFRKRQAVTLASRKLRCTVLLGGGYVAELYCPEAKVSPLWIPPWPTMEPWQYNPKRHKRRHGDHHESKLLAAIMGHNFCLDFFGEPSPDESKAGVIVHGESGVSRWKVLNLRKGMASASVTLGVTLPLSQLAVQRKLTVRRDSPVIDVAVRIRNLNRLDHPLTFNEHVTVGPPFLQKGVTVFDMPAGWAHTAAEDVGGINRLARNKSFQWPYAPGAKGKRVDVRLATAQRRNSDFSTQQVAKSREFAYLTALNPRQGALMGYVWRRAVCPWIGSWEENYSRSIPPWNRQALTRGLEFGNTPWPVSKREAIDLGKLQGDKTFGWVPARGELKYNFAAFVVPVDKSWRGVDDVAVAGREVTVISRRKSQRIHLKLGAAL